MRIPKYEGKADASANMTPMIDVVFLLIIFFLVSSHLARRENQIPLSLPDATSGEEQIDVSKPRVTLNVLPSGDLLLAGSPVDPKDLATSLSSAVQREGKDVELRIRADREALYRHVSPVLSAAAGNGIWNVTFSVVRGVNARANTGATQ